MAQTDRFHIELALGDWLYTLAIGMALGLLVASLLLPARTGKARRIAPGAVAFSGLAVLAAIALLAYDAGPFTVVVFTIKPYLSAVADAGLLFLALVLGVGGSASLVVGTRRLARGSLALVPAIAICALAVAFLLWRVDAYSTRNFGRHPKGTDASALVAAKPVITGLAVPTGVTVAENGDIAVVELTSAMFRLFTPDGDGYRQVIAVRLPIPEDRLAFHVALHPEYPAQPYVYVTSETGPLENRTLQVLRARLDRSEVRFTPIIEGLPAAKVEEGGNHFGAAITFCKGFLFVTTGDTEGTRAFTSPFDNPEVHRDEAQDLSSARGKILRWRLDGIEIVPDGVTGVAIPIFAFGFRNPFGITCDRDTGNPVVVDNGNRGHDQVRAVAPGSNHEWPISLERNLFREPLFDSGEVHIAPTGVAYRSSDTGGHEFIVSAFQSQAIYLLPVLESGAPGPLRLLIEVEGGAYGVTANSRGCTYFATADSIWRLEDGRCQE